MTWMGSTAARRVTGGLDDMTVHMQALAPAQIIAAFRSQGDKDIDGLPNAWEMENRHDPLDQGDATADVDGDGYTATDEYAAETDPLINPNGYTASINADAPTSYWKLDDVSVSAADETASALDGNYSGAYTQLEPSPTNAGYSAAFAAGQVIVPHDAALNPSGDYTLEGHFKWTGDGVAQLLGKIKPSSPKDGPAVYANYSYSPKGAAPGKIVFRDLDNTSYRMTANATGLNDGQWRHYAFVRRGTSLELYIDGELDSTMSIPQQTAHSTTEDFKLMDGMTSATSGSADEVAYYVHALSPADIYQHYLQGKEPNIASRQTNDVDSQFAKVFNRTDYLAVTRVFELPSYDPLFGREGRALYRYAADGSRDRVEDFTDSAFENARASALVTPNGTTLSVADPINQRRYIRRLSEGTGRRLIPVTGGSLAESWTYGYDAVSNITGITKPAGSESYGYDDLDRLDTYTLPGSSAVTYAYDEVGNRLSETESGVTQNSTYGTASNRHLTQAGSALTYDANGNRLTDQGGARTFAYNQRNRISSVSDGGGTIGTYLYNALGQRVNKVAGALDVDYVYDLQGQLIGEYANGVTIKEYVHFGSMPVAQIESGAVTYLHTDHLGTPREATDTNGQVVWRWESDPFGEAAANEDPDGDTNFVTVNLRFPGQYADSETGLSYNYFRTYDPSIGRYTQSDPIGLAGGLNTFAYVGGSPISNSDRLGLLRDSCSGSPACLAAMRYAQMNAGGARRASAGRALATAGVAASATQQCPTASNGDGEEEGDEQPSPAGPAWPSTSSQSSGERYDGGDRSDQNDDEEIDCEAQVLADEQMCRMATLPGSEQRARCWTSANERYGACRAGRRPLPPLVLW